MNNKTFKFEVNPLISRLESSYGDFEDIDFVIVGAGPAGCTVANRLASKGASVLILETASTVGGAASTISENGIMIHKYGPHIFHTSDDEIWDLVNNYCTMMPFINSPIANYKGEIYNLPFNMNTFVKMFGDMNLRPNSVKQVIETEISTYKKLHPEFDEHNPKNLEEKAISLVGTTIYGKLIKGYTCKQWGKDCTELSESIINRLPLRFTYDNNYFNDKYQGIPDCGYSELFLRMILQNSNKISIEMSFKFDLNILNYLMSKKDSNLRIIFTGSIDSLFEYKFGRLPYRSLRFEHAYIDGCDNYQGVAVMNYTDSDTPYTRITEHRHFDKTCKSNSTIITYEYPDDSQGIPYYPIESPLYNKYLEYLIENYGYYKVLLTGRAGNWKYKDMHIIMRDAIDLCEEIM